MKNALLALILTPLSAAAIADTSGNLVVNGSFENGATGWSVRADGINTLNVIGAFTDVAGTSFLAKDGLHWGDLRCAGYNECETGHWAGTTIDQALDTVAGGSYQVSLSVGNIGSFLQSPVDVYWNGARIATALAPMESEAGSWTTYSITGLIGTGRDVLSISTSAGAYGGAEIDAVSVTAVPEPMSWAMLVAGLAAVGALSRRRA